jgi:hypothetical protein
MEVVTEQGDNFKVNLINLAKEVAALAGYSITGTDTQSVSDKARALRRVNGIRADIISRFSGRWAGQYKEGYLPLVPVYGTGTVTVTINSRTVTGSGTTWTSAMVGRKFLGPDSIYYKIAAVASTTSLTLTEPYQSSTAAGGVYQIWKDEYPLYPDAFSIIDFVNYIDPTQMVEETNKHGRYLYPRSTANDTPRYFSIVGRQRNLSTYATGTVSGTINTRTLTGVGTLWFDNVQPGFEITIGSYTYHVDTVDSDTQITLRQDLVVTVAALTAYTARGRNALVVKFLSPSSQTMVNYSYYSKVYPLVNDNDEDWLLELYPHLVINGVIKWDYLDKNDAVRAQIAAQLYDNDIHNAHVADAGMFGGTATVGLDIPDSARE